jgi:hypothetical protein
MGQLTLDEHKLMASSKYGSGLGTVVEDSISPQTVIYLLRSQLVDAAILNHNLKRVVAFLVWKLNVERANAIIKADLAHILQESVDSLQGLLAQSCEKRNNLALRLEKLGYSLEQLKQQLETHRHSVAPSGPFVMLKARIRKPYGLRLPMRRDTSALGDCISRLRAGGASQNFPRRLLSNQALGGSLLGSCTKLGKVDEGNRGQFKEIKEEDEATTPMHRDAEEPGRPSISEKMVERPTSPFRMASLGGGCDPENLGKPSLLDASKQEQLVTNMHDTQIELAWQKTLSQLLMSELMKTREQAQNYLKQVVGIKATAEQAVHQENSNWKKITDTLKVSLNSDDHLGQLRHGAIPQTG